MERTATGTFTVQMTPQGAPDTADGVTLGQMALHKEFAGDLTGSGQGVMLTAMTAEDGSAGYVAVERVSGTLHGLSGSFVLQHTGHMDRGAQQLTIMVVAGSGSGALTGMRGSFALEVVGDEHRYSLTYSLPAP